MSGAPESTQISPRRKALFAVLLSSFSVLFGLAAAEVVLRWRANAAADEPEGRAGPKHTQASPHPDVVYELRPGQEGLFREQPLRVNALGLRGPETTLEKPPGVFRIVGIGDSFMFGWGVAQSEVYLRRVEEALNERSCPPGTTKPRFETLNFAVPGYNTVMEVATLEHRALAFAPDLVLQHFVGNDLAVPHFLDPDQDRPTSYLFDLVERALTDTSDAEDGEAGLPTRQLRRRSEASAPYARLGGREPFLAAMAKLAKLTAERGIPVWTVAVGHINNKNLQQAIRQHGFNYLNLGQALHRHLETTGQAADAWARNFRIPGDGHPTALAHRLFAEAIVERLAAEPSFPLCRQPRALP